MLWSADGSELLDYSGKPDDEFEWCRYVGNANLPLVGELPLETSLHERKQLYIENSPKMTYGILKKIVDALKSEGKRLFPNSEIKIGTTFDIGGEFAVYNRDNTVEARFKFPLGAPILDGYSTRLCDRFDSRQPKVKETSPVNAYYRRKITISGLENAAVALFGEEYCKTDCIVTEFGAEYQAPIPMDGWKIISDKENGTYLYGQNINGTVTFCMPEK